MALIDEISPPYIGEDKITLALADPAAAVLAFVPFQITVDYSASLEEEPKVGLVLPLELIFQSPTGSYVRTLFERSKPSSLLLVPRRRGDHLILLREMFHNRWQGRLIVSVQGDDLNNGETRIL
jgi:hypothetical protein